MKITKKVLTVVLATILLLGVIPFNVFADDVISGNPEGVWVAGVKVDSEEETYWLNDGEGSIKSTGASADNYNVKFTPASETAAASLALKNANLSEDVRYKTAYNDEIRSAVIYIKNDIDLTIVLEGTNTVNAKPGFTNDVIMTNSYKYRRVYGLIPSKNTILAGEGSLNINAEQCTLGHRYLTAEVCGVLSSVTVADKAKVTVDAKLTKGEGEEPITGKVTAIGGDLTAIDKAIVKVTASSEISRFSASGVNKANVSDKANVFISADYAINGDCKVNGGTFEAIATNGLANSSYGYEIELRDPRRCTVKLNTEATAEGAKRWNGDEDSEFIGEDFDVRLRDCKYVKVKYMFEPISTMSMVFQTMWNVFRVLVKGLFNGIINFPIKVYNVVRIIIENIEEYRDYYGK